MIKPRYFSVKRIRGDKRGFYFTVLGLLCLLLFPLASSAQQTLTAPSITWILVIGSDTLVLRKPPPVLDLNEAAYEEAWRYGYFQSQLNDADRFNDTLRAVFLPAERFKWGDQPIEWVSDSTLEIQACIFSGPYYAASEVEDCALKQVENLARSGYLSTSIVIDSLRIDYSKKMVSAVVSIAIGDIARLSDITWVGLSQTGSNWLENAIGVTVGMPLDEWSIRRISGKLHQTKLFYEVSQPDIYRDGEKWGLSYSVSERPLTFVDLLVGYVPDQSGKAVVAGTGTLHVRNAGFDGTDLKLDFDRQSPRVGRLLIALDQRMFLGYPLGISSSFSLVRQDTLWQNRNASFGVWWDVHDNLRVKTAVNRDVSASSSTNEGSADLWGTFGQLGITLDTRDEIDLTSPGVLVDIMAESGRQLVKPSHADRYNHTRKKISANVDLHLPFNPRNILITGITSGTVLSKRAPFINDLWRIGGTKSLRGYKEDQFFAKSYMWGNLEYRFLLDPFSYLFAFGSTGFLWLPQIDVLNDATVRKDVGSFGFGLAYRTNLGLLKFSYAKSPEDPITNAKVHIGISSGF